MGCLKRRDPVSSDSTLRRTSFMNSMADRTAPIRTRVVAIALCVAFGSVGAACVAHRSAYPSRRMPDGKQWTTHNLAVNTVPSYCYEDAELNCRRYGRLYTWESARRGCQSLGDGWRLPTDDEWRQMAKRYGGIA